MNLDVKESGGAVTFNVKVVPGSSKNEITGVQDGAIKVKITAAPDKGRANKELIDFLSGVFNVRKTAITLIKGEKSRLKSLKITGITKSDIEKHMEVFS